LEELENEVQKLIEQLLIDENWASAYGHVESPDKGGHEGYFYNTSKPAASVYEMGDFLSMREAVRKVLRHANKKGCNYNLARDGKIEFDFEE
jgi:hypothetical protein